MTPEAHSHEALIEAVAALLKSDGRTAHLADQLPAADDESPLRIALFGPTNAGKTLLLAELLELGLEETEQLVAATPKTSEVTAHPWSGHTLLDLPGTQSGIDEHDYEAALGLRQADLLLIVTTVELPGPQETERIRSLLTEEGFADRCVVVVNKSNAESSSSDIIRTEVRSRLGAHGSDVPVVLTDARDHADARHDPSLTDAERALLLSDSGFDDLRTAIDELIARSGRNPRQATQQNELLRILDLATAAWEETPDEQALSAIADRMAQALTRAENDLRQAAQQALSILRDTVVEAGQRLASQVTTAEGLSPTAVEAAGRAVTGGEKELGVAIGSAVEEALAALSADFEIARDRHAAYTSAHSVTPPEGPAPQSPTGKADDILDRLIQRLTTEAGEQMTRLLEGSTRPGSAAHQVGSKINRALRRQPRPYIHVNTAKTVQKTARGVQFVADVAGPALDAKKLIDDATARRRVNQYREKIRVHYIDAAEETVNTHRHALDQYFTEVMADYRDAAAPIVDAVTELRSAAERAGVDLSAMRRRVLEQMRGDIPQN